MLGAVSGTAVHRAQSLRLVEDDDKVGMRRISRDVWTLVSFDIGKS